MSDLSTAMERRKRLPCTGDPRFTSDSPEQRADVLVLCDPCPLRDLCREAGKDATAGFWGGIDRSPRRRRIDPPWTNYGPLEPRARQGDSALLDFTMYDQLTEQDSAMATDRITLTNGYTLDITDEDKAQAARLVIGLAEGDALAINAVMQDVLTSKRPGFVMALGLLAKSTTDAAIYTSSDPFRTAADVLRGFLLDQAKEDQS